MLKRLRRSIANARATMATTPQIIAMLPGQANAEALRLIEVLKERECHQDGTMRGADLARARLDGVRLAQSDLGQVVFREARLVGAYFGAAILKAADFQGAVLNNANLRDADLRGAVLKGADLRAAHLAGADLWNADLTDADLRGANLWGARLNATRLRGARLNGANLANAVFDIDTILPDGTRWTEEVDPFLYTHADADAVDS